MATKAPPDRPAPEPITLWWLMSRAGETLTLPEQIAAQVAERIVTGVLAPGQALNEQAIAAEFEVSRVPVREALRILERQQLVEIQARKAAQVAPLDADRADELAEVVAALLQVVVRRLASMGNPEIVGMLESKTQDLITFAEDPAGPARYLWGVQDLMVAMATASGNRRAASILEEMMLMIYRYARLSAMPVLTRHRTAKLWRDVTKRIKRLDGDGAAGTISQIVGASRERARAIFGKAPPPDETK